MENSVIYITKYVLTKGIAKKFEASVYKDENDNVVAKCTINGVEQILYGTDFFINREEAIDYAKTKMAHKLKTLNKTIEKLKKLCEHH